MASLPLRRNAPSKTRAWQDLTCRIRCLEKLRRSVRSHVSELRLSSPEEAKQKTCTARSAGLPSAVVCRLSALRLHAALQSAQTGGSRKGGTLRHWHVEPPSQDYWVASKEDSCQELQVRVLGEVQLVSRK